MNKEELEIKLGDLTLSNGKYAIFPEIITFKEELDGLTLIYDFMLGSTEKILYRDLVADMLKTEEGKKQLAIAISNLTHKDEGGFE